MCLGCSYFMHHVVLAPQALHILISPHVYAYTLDHVEPKLEIQAEQVQKEYDGPQAPSARILTFFLDQGKPRCITPHFLTFILN
jgi:hypothetical protein